MAGPWEKYGNAQPTAPVDAPGLIRGRPKPVDPYKEQEQAYKAQDQEFKAQDQQFQAEDNARKQSTDEFTKFDKLRSDFDALQPVKSYKAALPSYMTALKTPDTPQGDLALIYAFAKVMDPDSVVREGEAAAVASSDTLAGQTVAALKKQLTGTGTFSPEARNNLRRELQNKVSELNRAYNTERSRFKELANRFGYNPDEVIGPHFGTTSEQIIQDYWDKQRGGDSGSGIATSGAAGNGDLPDGLPPEAKEAVYDGSGQLVGYLDENGEMVTTFRTPERQDYDRRVSEAAKLQGEPGYGTRADTGITFGLSDEAAGVGGAIGSLLRGDNVVDGYTFARDVERERQKQADANTGFSGDVVEIGSSLLIPGGAARTPMQAAKAGATFGAIGGFGYGEGAKGSTVNALLGAGAGAGLGAGISKGISAASNRIASRAANKQAQNALAQAATDEGTILNKAMADPSLMAKTRAVSSTMTGAPIVQKGMAQAGDSIQNALATNVGKSGQVLERPNAGSAMQGAFQRADKNKKSNVDRLYDAYQKASGDPAIVPNDAIAALDNQLGKLKRSPDTNKAEIADLEGLRADLTNGKVTDEALRNIRTAKRETFKANNLSFSQRETRMMDILDAANDDIAKGLDPTSPGYALLQRANKAHKERVVFKKQLMADLIGKDRDLPTDPGKAFETILNWTNPRGDLRKLEALKRASTTDEWKDFGATVIDSFAKDKSGNFSTTALVASIERLNKAGPKTIETLFGKDGAKSLKNIELLAREHKRVMNGIAGQGSAQGNDFRSWLFTALLPAGAGAGYAGGSTTTGLVAGAAAVTAKVARDFLTAKSVMSPKITGWLRATPKTTSPAVINAHFNKLTAIAKAEPALANDIDALRELILQAANDNANKAVAEDRKSEGMR